MAKNQAMDNDNNNCVLLLDEMQLSMLVEYDHGEKKLLATSVMNLLKGQVNQPKRL